MTDVVKVEGVSKYFNNTGQVLDGTTFSVGHSEILGLLGPNGSGKTTLLKIMVNLLKEDSGTTQFWGQRYEKLESPVTTVGTLLDPSWVDERMKVDKFIISHLIMLKVPCGNLKTLANNVLDEVGLKKSVNRKISELSLGMRQRVSLACSISTKPKLLILDEPLNGLDADGVLWFQDLLRSHRSNGGSAVLSSHLMAEMENVADSVAILNGGKIVAQGNVGALSRKNRTLIGTDDNLLSLKSVFMSQGFEDVTESGTSLSIGGVSPSEASSIAFRNGFSVSSLSKDEETLEDFYRLTVAQGN